MDTTIYEPSWVQTFLAMLHSGTVLPQAAARHAGTTLKSVLKYRDENAEFAEAYDEAVTARAELIENEVWRRGVDGIEKGVYYKGERVDTELQYSDTLLVKLAEAYAPEKFSSKVQHNHGGAVTVLVREFPLPTLMPAQEPIDAEFKALPNNPMDFV